MKRRIQTLMLLGLTLCGWLSSQGAGPGAQSRRERDFDSGWRFLRADAAGAEQGDFDDSGWRRVDVPHDWSIEDLPPGTAAQQVGPFTPDSPGGSSTGYVLGGTGWYRKHFAMGAADAGKGVTVLFDGVYMDADVWINGRHLGNHPYGYTAFAYDLTPHVKPAGQENVLAVRVRNLGKNSRWYSGSGIYRHVSLLVTDPLRVGVWGVQITTPSVAKEAATVKLTVTLENARVAEGAVTVSIRVVHPSGKKLKPVSALARVAANGRAEVPIVVEVDRPALWSPAHPELYRAEITVSEGGKVIDQTETEFGIRSIRFEVKQGFLLNGEPFKMRGGCVHHDNGPLGSAAFDRAEERRVELLKANGFNAIRTSHNPPSTAFLNACDRLGMLVIDEAFDMWERGKNPDDYHRFFKDWWERDLAAMVMRDRNHPCVVLWSIGNEISERAEPSGVAIAERLVAAIKRMDCTRPVTAAICHFWDHPGLVWSNTAPAFGPLDVGGYNYREGQYVPDHKEFPGRIMVGTESYPRAAFACWSAVEEDPWVVGDFVWTALDYLGEAGIGHARLDNESNEFGRRWPWFNAFCGDLDLCGFKKPQSYYRDVVWRRMPMTMMVHAPLPAGRTEKVSDWGWPDELPSWTWPGCEAKLMQVSVYSRCDTVRLLLNGQEVGVARSGADTKLTARFEVPYAAGELRAVGMVGGKESASVVLRSAGKPARLRVTADRARIAPHRGELAYYAVEITDAAGNLIPDAAVPVRFSVTGPAELVAVGSANPRAPASFRAPVRTTFQGRCLAILRSTGTAGTMVLRAEADGLRAAEAKVKAL